MPGPTPQLYDVDLMNAEQERDLLDVETPTTAKYNNPTGL
jgi:hypothetical protein